MIGKTLAHYEITDLLGKGGMGAVYRARDTTLRRDVALKVLPHEFAQDVERLARFQREARTLASLSHPNIAPLFGYEEADGERFLVMELIEGEDLSQRLERGRLSIDEALEIATQIAEGLEAAHEKDIVHRDLKPANVKLTPEGQVKLLDFGLARATIRAGTDDSNFDHSPTITAAFTGANTILGTAAYMSPEQARGRPVDKRADIWAFGVLLFEMLTGRRLFEGETVSDTLAGILKSPPEWSQLPQETPPRVRELLDRCLAKRRRDRLRDIGDARLELVAAQAPAGSPVSGILEGAAVPSSDTTRRTLVTVAVAMLLLGGGAGAALWAMLGGAGSAVTNDVTSLSLTLPAGRVGGDIPRISPDGSVVLYAERHEDPSNPDEQAYKYFLRRLNEYEPRLVENSYGGSAADFSPDGRWIAYVGRESASSSIQQLYKVRIDGRSPPILLGNWAVDWGSLIWATPDDIITTTFQPQQMIRIAADGTGVRDSVQISKPNEDGLFVRSTLPNGNHALCVSVSFGEAGYQRNASLLDLQTGVVTTLVEDADNASWSSTGHLLFTRHDNLLAVPFDLERMVVTGGPIAILEGLRVGTVWSGAFFSLSSTGTLVYGPGGVMGAHRRLVILNEDGSSEDWNPQRRSYGFWPRPSPDGDWIAVVGFGETGFNEIWVSRTEQRDHRVLVAEPGLDCQRPVFSPVDGRIVYDCNATGSGGGLYIRRVDGSGKATLLRGRREDEFLLPIGFWPDGTRVLYARLRAGGMDVFEHPADTPTNADDEIEPLISGAALRVPGLSPDGRWISYVSEATSRPEIHIRRYLGPGEVGEEVPVTSTGATSHWWSPQVADDGTVGLYYRTQDGKYVAVDVHPGSTPRFSRRALTVLSPIFRNATGVGPLGDGRWLAILKGEEEVPLREYRVITNWTRQLESLLAAESN